MIGRVGLASVMPTLTVSAISNLRPKQLTQDSGAINFTRQLGGALGINLISTGSDSAPLFSRMHLRACKHLTTIRPSC